MELDTLGDRKTALFLIMSDTDVSFNFLISMCYTPVSYTHLDVYKRQVDDLFSTEESRADAQRERVLEIPLSELHLSLIHI